MRAAIEMKLRISVKRGSVSWGVTVQRIQRSMAYDASVTNDIDLWTLAISHTTGILYGTNYASMILQSATKICFIKNTLLYPVFV